LTAASTTTAVTATAVQTTTIKLFTTLYYDSSQCKSYARLLAYFGLTFLPGASIPLGLILPPMGLPSKLFLLKGYRRDVFPHSRLCIYNFLLLFPFFVLIKVVDTASL